MAVVFLVIWTAAPLLACMIPDRDDSSREGTLQARGPDVRIGEHAAVGLLL
jgi:hypothetical protein